MLTALISRPIRILTVGNWVCSGRRFFCLEALKFRLLLRGGTIGGGYWQGCMEGTDLLGCRREGIGSSPGRTDCLEFPLPLRERLDKSSERSTSDSSRKPASRSSVAVLMLVPRLRVDGARGGPRLSRSAHGERNPPVFACAEAGC